MIERCHRGRHDPRKQGTRKIIAAFHDWNDAEYVKDCFRSLNVLNKSTIYVEQKFGPLATFRRNQALNVRKSLKADGHITRGYVSFPAKLMVQRPGEKKYVLHENFSDMPVVFNGKSLDAR